MRARCHVGAVSRACGLVERGARLRLRHPRAPGLKPRFSAVPALAGAPGRDARGGSWSGSGRARG